MYKYENVNWSMPFLFTEGSLLIPILYSLFKNETIKYVYGAPRCNWSGGRPSNVGIKNLKLIERIIYKIKEYDVTPSFTFTNTGITKELLKDDFCNSLLKIIAESGSEVILVSDLLYEHVKNKYPNIRLCASVLQSTFQNIKGKNEAEHINKLTDKYDRVVIRPEYAIIKDGDFSEIKDVSKLELVVNQGCAMNCYCANDEYRLIEYLDKGLITHEEFQEKASKICPRDTGIIKETNLVPENLVNKCIQAGITKLKLNGRHVNFNNLITVLNNYFFSDKTNEKELKEKINDYIVSTTTEKASSQIHAILNC